jgi:hypothetical protein
MNACWRHRTPFSSDGWNAVRRVDVAVLLTEARCLDSYKVARMVCGQEAGSTAYKVWISGFLNDSGLTPAEVATKVLRTCALCLLLQDIRRLFLSVVVLFRRNYQTRPVLLAIATVCRVGALSMAHVECRALRRSQFSILSISTEPADGPEAGGSHPFKACTSPMIWKERSRF